MTVETTTPAEDETPKVEPGEQTPLEDEAPEVSEEEDGTEPSADEEQQDDPVWLREQLTETRKEAAARRIAQREAEEALSKAKSPEEYEAAVKDFTDKINVLEAQIKVRDIADEMKIPAELRPLLKGDTEEEIRATAELLKQHVVRTPVVDEDALGGGLNGTTPPATELDPGALARQYPRR